MSRMIPILKETNTWVVIDKPPGIVVHPPHPKSESTTPAVTDWFVGRYPIAAELPWPDPTRPGIVHRLDTDTSGVLLLAKNPGTLTALQTQFKERTVKKIYQALVLGEAPDQTVLIGMIQRKEGSTEHAVKRLSFSWDKAPQKPAETQLHTLRRLHDEHGRIYTLVQLEPKTGRTHQLRVQLLDAGLPIIGDAQYSTKASREASDELGLHRQFLHAMALEFTDPASSERIHVTSTLPQDLQSVLDTVG